MSLSYLTVMTLSISSRNASSEYFGEEQKITKKDSTNEEKPAYLI